MASDDQLNDLAAEWISTALYASQHVSAAGTTGAGEATYSGYARLPLTWTATSVPGQYVSDPLEFTLPADTDLTDIGIWDAITAGNFRDSFPNEISADVDTPYSITLKYTQKSGVSA